MNKLSLVAAVSVVAISVCGVARAADDDSVIRQPSVAVDDNAKSANDLKKERDEAIKQAQENARRAAQAEKEAQQAKQQANQAAQQQAQAQQPAAQQTVQTPAVAATTGFVSLTRVKVTTDKREGVWTTDVTTYITLTNVPNQPFTYQATLVGADGKPHTDIQGRTYSASREVSTGDADDTDKYTVTIPLNNLFTSRPPDLYVQTVLLDAQGRVVATAPLQYFAAPTSR